MTCQISGHRSIIMKTNKLKLAVLLSAFVALTNMTVTTVSAAGAYDLGTVLSDVDHEVLKPVNAGIEGLAPQIVMTLSALSGIALTSFLIKKTK